VTGEHAFTDNQERGFFMSQNHRIVGAGRDLCGSSRPTHLPKQGQGHYFSCYVTKSLHIKKFW